VKNRLAHIIKNKGLKMPRVSLWLKLILAALWSLWWVVPPLVSAADAQVSVVTDTAKNTGKELKEGVFDYENALIHLRLIARTTEQMAAFFEARGFPMAMIKTLEQYCFFTTVISNKSQKILWLDLPKWQFFYHTGGADEQQVARLPRQQWPQRWVQLAVPMSAQSTFRWTLLPEQLDFQPGETEGGNVIVAKTKALFSLRAPFVLNNSVTAEQEQRLVAQIDGLRCDRNTRPMIEKGSARQQP
jgi:hypothetical protein